MSKQAHCADAPLVSDSGERSASAWTSIGKQHCLYVCEIVGIFDITLGSNAIGCAPVQDATAHAVRMESL